jgi:predicted site-specific integrase-resolvase
MATNVEIPALVSREEAAAILGVSVRSVDRLREAGRLHAIQYLERGRIRYRLRDIETLLEPETRAMPFAARPDELQWH